MNAHILYLTRLLHWKLPDLDCPAVNTEERSALTNKELRAQCVMGDKSLSC